MADNSSMNEILRLLMASNHANAVSIRSNAVEPFLHQARSPASQLQILGRYTNSMCHDLKDVLVKFIA